MDSKKLFWLYLGGVVLAVVCLWLVWHFFSDQILWASGWLVVFGLVFGAGWVLGRFGRRKADAQQAAKKR